MVVQTLKKTHPLTAFVYERVESLSNWGKGLAERSGPIYAISRKAPRLLELLVREGVVNAALLHRTTTERGLLIDLHELPAGEEPIVCDDSVIVGSTFRRVSDVVSEAFKGVSVRGYPFAVNRDADEDNLGAISEFSTYLANDNCCSFVNAETSAFGFLDKPYDIEHPILYVPLHRDVDGDAIERSLGELAKFKGFEAYPTPRRLALWDGEIDKRHAWTVLFPGHRNACFLRKIRIYFDRTHHRLLLVPISPPVGTIDEIRQQASRLPEELVHLCDSVLARLDDRTDASDGFERVRQRTIVSWIAFVLELADLSGELFVVLDALVTDGILSSREPPTVGEFDLQLLIGRTSAPQIKRDLDRYLLKRPHSIVMEGQKNDGPHSSPVIPPSYRESYEKALSELLDDSCSPFEILEAAFKAQHVGIEIPSRGESPTNADRLEFGVPLEYLWQLAEKNHSAFAPAELHAALDALIDRGVIVPRFLSQEINGRIVWFRSFRVGERQAEIVAHATRECVQTLQAVIGGTSLGETVAEKFLVLAAEYLSIFRDPSLASERGFTRGFHLYGARPRVQVDREFEWLVDWAQRRRILKRTSGRQGLSYQLDERAAPYFREHERSLSPDTRMQITLLAHWTKAAYETKGLGTDFLVALTTVESPWSYKEALDAELREWVHHPTMGCTAALNALEDLARNNKPLPTVDKVLGELSNWYAQARKKYLLRSKLDSFLEAADNKWPSESVDSTAQTWVNKLRPVFDAHSQRKPKPVDVIDTSLSPTLRVVGCVSSLLRDTVSSFTGLHADRARPLSESTERVVTSIEALPIGLRDHFYKAVPLIEAVSEASDLLEAVAGLREPVEIIAGAVDWVRNRFPDLADEPFDTLEPGLFLLFWDMRDSTGNKTREDVTRRVVEVNRLIKSSYSDRLVEFDEDSTDDGSALVCREFDVALQISKEIVSFLTPEYQAKMACETNARGNLHRGRTSSRLSGRAFEYAARLMTFFSEVKRDAEVWRRDGTTQSDGVPDEPDSTLSYLLLSEEAFRLAEEQGFEEDLADFKKLPGRYKSRIYGSIGQDVHVREFTNVAPTEPANGMLPF